MGLSALNLRDMDTLAQLAANPQGMRRDDIWLAVASLFRTQALLLSERERLLMREIMQRLTQDVEMAIRIALAEKLADDPDAPLELILLLVDDRIEVARPIILRSKRLSDQELLALIPRVDALHQAACASRPNIGQPVTDALARSDAETVLVALLRNLSAHISPKTFETLVEKSRQISALQEPLAQREDLPNALATKMCAWVSEALKAHIVRAYRVTPIALADAIESAAKSVSSAPATDALEGGRKLIEKLAAAGQLKAGFLLRVLGQGQIDIFEIAFARMLGLEQQRMREILYENGPRYVALACRAVGIDRCVFPTVFNLSRRARNLPSRLTDEEQGDVKAVFSGFTKTEAHARLSRPG